MELAGKKGRMTRILILRELVIGSPRDQRSIAEVLGITPQAISGHLKRMAVEGLVDLSRRPPRATVEGVDMLQRELLGLKGFIDDSIQRLDIIASTDAIAASRIRRGQRVSLFIREGLLYCAPGDGGPSTGTAGTDGDAGEVVTVTGLHGVIDMPRTGLILVEIRPARQGGGNARLPSSVIDDMEGRYHLEGGTRVGALDLEAASLLLRSRIPCDLELPNPLTIRENLERGLSLVCLGTPHSVSRILSSPEMSSLGSRIIRTELSDLAPGAQQGLI